MQYEHAVRAAVKRIDSTVLVTGILPADALIGEAQTTTRFTLLLIGSFGMIAGLLAGIGIYGVLSSAVRQRTAEIGIRIALGAKKRQIFELVLNEGVPVDAYWAQHWSGRWFCSHTVDECHLGRN